jgi:hypothetical protein
MIDEANRSISKPPAVNYDFCNRTGNIILQSSYLSLTLNGY